MNCSNDKLPAAKCIVWPRLSGNIYVDKFVNDTVLAQTSEHLSAYFGGRCAKINSVCVSYLYLQIVMLFMSSRFLGFI